MNKVKKAENKAVMQYDSVMAGQSVRDLREAKGWTIEKLAEEVDKSESHIHQLELGHRNMSLELLFALMGTFGTDANTILGVKDKECSTEEISIDAMLERLPKEQQEYLKRQFIRMIEEFPM